MTLTGNIFLTGGAGFLGRGIMRRAQRDEWPARFTVYSRDEHKQMLAAKKYPARYLLGDITDFSRMALAMIGHDTVIHTAALKYIPEGEANASECVRVNVDGTRAVMAAAREAGVKTVICISTDKAPQPLNTYGMTKALVERLVGETYDQIPGDPKFVACRYGNVIGSTGSIWPVWMHQWAHEARIGVTDPSMTRFFMSIDEAVDLIVASMNAPSGVVVLPSPRGALIDEIATSVATHLIKRRGTWPQVTPDQVIKVIGRRPGEKQHEQMLAPNEWLRLAPHGDYLKLLPPGRNVSFTDRAFKDETLLTSAEARVVKGEEFVGIALDSEDV